MTITDTGDAKSGVRAGSELSREIRGEPTELVMLVEDNRADAFLVQQAIEVHRVPVRLAVVEDGEAATRYLERAGLDADKPCPRILLLDLNLPKRSGIEVLECLRASERCQGIRVIVLTSSDSLDDRRDAARLGAAHYFRKPTSYHEFLEIGSLLNQMLQGEAEAD